MNLTAYNLNTQYLKTELKYETKITSVSNEEFKVDKKTEEDKDIDSSIINAPVLYANENDLSNVDKLRKMLMEKILGGFNLNDSPETLFPNENIDISKETYNNNNPYTQNNADMPQAFLYSSSEYYEKTTIEFKAEATIKTPGGTYKIELNFSYTKEFYEKNETQIAIANEQFKNPFDIELEKDDESLKGLKSLHFIFDILNEQEDEKVDLFKEIKELLKQRRDDIDRLLKKDRKEDAKIEESPVLNNFQVWQENSSHEMDLIVVKKDGLGIFLTNSSSQSSYLNLNVDNSSYSLESSYSYNKTTYAEIVKE